MNDVLGLMGWVTALQLVFVMAVVVYLTSNMLHLVRVEPVAGPLPSSPKVSICVPARNEERGIEACLESLLNQDYPDFEVIVVDDDSTDATPRIIESLTRKYPRLKAIRSRMLPAGWLGKPCALHEAYKVTRGDYLLFTDADPVFQPHALTSAMYVMLSRDLDLLTLMPRAEFGSFWERAVQPVVFGFIAALTRFKEVNSPDSSSAMGFGAFLLFRKTAYQQFGGHVRVKDEVLEDVMLARQVKMSGFKLLVADAKSLFSIRMYHSFGEIWSGWRKNVFCAMRRSVSRTLYFIFSILVFTVTPYLVLVYNLWAGAGWLWCGLSMVSLGAVLITGIALCDELKLERRTVFLFPLGAMALSLIMLNSMFHGVVLGETEWRGRVYGG